MNLCYDKTPYRLPFEHRHWDVKSLFYVLPPAVAARVSVEAA